jgi:hypothetical protein
MGSWTGTSINIIIQNEGKSAQVLGKTSMRRSLALPCLRSVQLAWDVFACRAVPTVYLLSWVSCVSKIIHENKMACFPDSEPSVVLSSQAESDIIPVIVDQTAVSAYLLATVSTP